jgi:RNA polymerase sigma-70 factor (ECF subfamily)
MSEVLDEAALIRAAQNGKLVAFNRLVLDYQTLAYNVAYRILSEPDAASDATQDAFLKAYKAIGQFRGGSFKAWLMRIVTNVCYDQLRAKQRRPTDSLDDLLADPEHAPVLINGREGPEAHALREELNRAIQACIGLLPADQRITLVLSDIQGMNYQEIADTTGVSVGTVKSRLSRGRAKLRDALLAHRELLPRAYRLNSEPD